MDGYIRACWWWHRMGVKERLLDRPVRYLAQGLSRPVATVGWGRKRSGRIAALLARLWRVPAWQLEDGFVRSFMPGAAAPALSMVVDEEGIYYDSTVASTLERLLEGPEDLWSQAPDGLLRARDDMLRLRISKYNHAPMLVPGVLRGDDRMRVLVVDQTYGDLSVLKGGGDALTFTAMLEAARRDHPDATIYVKTHPEVSEGRKSGYLTHVRDDAKTVVLREAVNPLSLMEQMDKVYVVSSTMGFEALLLGKTVACFGLPWYAGWGVTQDRQSCTRRARRRSVDELFVAAYGLYARYLDPQTHERGTLADVLPWLQLQREVTERFAGRMICVGFRRWKAANLKSMLSLHSNKVVFAENAEAAAALQPQGADCLVCWGRVPPAGLEAVADACGVRLLRMEDGFVRSVGLGSDLIPPHSFVLDAKGIYFDPSQPSELEDMLNIREFTSRDIQRAHWVREFIVRHGMTKYNIESLKPVQWHHNGQEVVLVPGQVEDDASIRFGCDPDGVCTNLGLIKAAREQFPQAFIVYKPHPDVMSGNRRGSLALTQARQWADHVETSASVVSCIEACDAVVTMTSLTGFDALLRGKKVVVHGRPFYAGWGLTHDMLPIFRRGRALTLDELVAGTLLHYPLYWDPVLKGYTTCEAVLRQVLKRREELAHGGRLHHLHVGYVRRQMRKLKILIRSFW